MSLWGIDAAAFGLLALATVISVWWRRRELTGRAEGRFRTAGPLLTPTEQTFFHALRRALAGRAAIFCKVRLWDVARAERASGARVALMMRQHLDFVIVDRETFRPLCIIELDDRSHRTGNAQWRDAVKDAALSGAGVPLVRIEAAQHYDTAQIEHRIRDAVRLRAAGESGAWIASASQTEL